MDTLIEKINIIEMSTLRLWKEMENITKESAYAKLHQTCQTSYFNPILMYTNYLKNYLQVLCEECLIDGKGEVKSKNISS